LHIKNDELLGAISDIREKKGRGWEGDKGRGFCSIWNLAQGQFTLGRPNFLLRNKFSSNNEKNQTYLYFLPNIFLLKKIMSLMHPNFIFHPCCQPHSTHPPTPKNI
jgi:hypothetical protein